MQDSRNETEYDGPALTLGRVAAILGAFGLMFVVGGLTGYILAPTGIDQTTWKKAQADADAQRVTAEHEAAVNAVWQSLRRQAKRPDSVELSPGRITPAFYLTGQFTAATETGETKRHAGTWFIITTPAGESAVVPYPAPPPPEPNLIALEGLPAAELVAIVQDLEKDNATLRHINTLQKAKLEERDSLPPSPFQGFLPP